MHLYSLSGRPDYDDDGSYDDYDAESYHTDGGDYDDESEEPQPSLNPQFTTDAKHFKVEPGHTIRLPCMVDRLGKKNCGITVAERRKTTAGVTSFVFLSSPLSPLLDNRVSQCLLARY
jgi:hypothetical protein